MNNEWVFHRLADHQLFEDGYFFNLSELDHEGPVDTPPASPVYVNSAEPQIITYPRYGDFFMHQLLKVRGHSKTMWTKFYPILTTYAHPPQVDKCEHSK